MLGQSGRGTRSADRFAWCRVHYRFEGKAHEERPRDEEQGGQEELRKKKGE